MTTENGLVVTQVTGGETRSYLTNPNEWMGNVLATTDPVTGRITNSSGGVVLFPQYQSLGSNTVALVGDSRVTQQFNEGTNIRSTMSYSWWAFFNQMSGGRYSLIQTSGVSGDKISDIVARQNNPQPGIMFGNLTAPGWTPYRPRILFVTAYINDALNAVALATSLAGAATLLDAAMNTGTYVVWPTETPFGPSMGTPPTQAKIDAITAWNVGLQGLKATYPNLITPDCYTAFLDPANLPYSYAGLHNDEVTTGIHFNNAGGLLYAQTIWAGLPGYLIPPENNLVLAGNASEVIVQATYPEINQYQLHPLFEAANAGANGVAKADTNQASTMTQITDPDGYGNAIQLDITNVSGSAGYTYVAIADSYTNCVGGENLVGAVKIKIGAAGGSPGVLAALTTAHNVECAEHLFQVTDGGTTYTRKNFLSSPSTNSALRSGISGPSITPAYKVSAAAPTKCQQSFYLRTQGNVTGTVRVIISRATIRNIPTRSQFVPVFG